MISPAKRLIEVTRFDRPDIFELIMLKIQPHNLNSVLKLIDCHLRKTKLSIFNKNREAVPMFMWAVIKHMHFPTPGDAIGIIKACRVTKSDTQSALDSKHLSSMTGSNKPFYVENGITRELALHSVQKHVFEFSNRRNYSTVYTSCSIEKLMKLLPETGHLIRGAPYNKVLNFNGEFEYLTAFKYILVEDRNSVKILYKKDLFIILRRISPQHILAFSDVRTLFQKCGIVSHFFNMMKVAERQLFPNNEPTYETDARFIMKYQCRSGKPLSMNRDGLAKNPGKTPLEIAGFEAMKTNLARACINEKWYSIDCSTDAIFFGEQFKEGTGYQFALLPK